MTLFALKFTDRTFGGFTVPTPWFTSAETFSPCLCLPLASLSSLRRIKSSASPPMKTASAYLYGTMLLVMQRAAAHSSCRSCSREPLT